MDDDDFLAAHAALEQTTETLIRQRIGEAPIARALLGLLWAVMDLAAESGVDLGPLLDAEIKARHIDRLERLAAGCEIKGTA